MEPQLSKERTELTFLAVFGYLIIPVPPELILHLPSVSSQKCHSELQMRSDVMWRISACEKKSVKGNGSGNPSDNRSHMTTSREMFPGLKNAQATLKVIS